jgi:argininosuccinate lyase
LTQDGRPAAGSAARPAPGKAARPPAGAAAWPAVNAAVQPPVGRPARAGAPAGPPAGPPAEELIAAGFELENADAPLLHHAINLADIAHLLDLGSAGVIPPEATRRLLGLLLETLGVPAEQFPYDPAYGEPYNSRERYFVERVGDVAGWMHAGRPRREALRIAFRLRLRDDLTCLMDAAAGLAAELGRMARAHATTLMADQTYLQHAQPSTFGHYLLSFAFPVLRAGKRLSDALAWTDTSPGGAGCVNGTRLRSDRGHVAALLGFRGIAEHTRDAMWQTDGLFDMVSAAAGLVLTQAKMGEDLEIWASQEFDYVTLADGYSRASVLMPQKRNPYALSIIRGAAGTLIGRLTGLLAVAKTPSARSDNLIFAYGEVPRALDLAIRTTHLSTGTVRTLEVNTGRMRATAYSGFSQATDLAEYIMQACGIDYRTAYRMVGRAVREASAAGLRGVDIDGALLDRVAVEITGRPLGLAGQDLSAVLDPWQIVTSRTALGGAAPGEVTRMAADACAQAASLAAEARRWHDTYARAEVELIETARRCVQARSDQEFTGNACAVPRRVGNPQH